MVPASCSRLRKLTKAAACERPLLMLTVDEGVEACAPCCCPPAAPNAPDEDASRRSAASCSGADCWRARERALHARSHSRSCADSTAIER
eukprot:1237454-Rhodomonas_salina.1